MLPKAPCLGLLDVCHPKCPFCTLPMCQERGSVGNGQRQWGSSREEGPGQAQLLPLGSYFARNGAKSVFWEDPALSLRATPSQQSLWEMIFRPLLEKREPRGPARSRNGATQPAPGREKQLSKQRKQQHSGVRICLAGVKCPALPVIPGQQDLLTLACSRFSLQ